jgi:putative addiction module component (TIGR02574 family)
MTQSVSRLLAEAMLLSDEERGDLATRLLESLDPSAAESVDEAWALEILQRVNELKQGTVKPIPWEEARRLIMEDSDEAAGS